MHLIERGSLNFISYVENLLPSAVQESLVFGGAAVDKILLPEDGLTGLLNISKER